MRSTIGFAGLALALIFPGALRAETINCTDVTGVPAFITAPGIYCLKSSLTSEIHIQADDVVLDLNGYVLDTSNWGASAGISSYDRQNITIRNGTVRGFHTAIQLDGKKSRGHLIEYMRLTDNAGPGVSVSGDGSVVRHNMLINNGYAPGAGARYGLLAVGDGIHIADNQVVETGVGATNEVVGIRVGGSGIAIERNVVSNAEIGPHDSRGILVSGTPGMGRNSVVNNRVVNMKLGIWNSSGIAVFMDNTVGGATAAPFLGGVMAGTTNTSF